MRDVTCGRWLVQARTREWIMTKTLLRQEAEDLVEIAAWSSFAMVVVSCPEAFTERQRPYSSVPLQCH